jgi:hypothetical protein
MALAMLWSSAISINFDGSVVFEELASGYISQGHLSGPSLKQ